LLLEHGVGEDEFYLESISKKRKQEEGKVGRVKGSKNGENMKKEGGEREEMTTAPLVEMLLRHCRCMNVFCIYGHTHTHNRLTAFCPGQPG